MPRIGQEKVKAREELLKEKFRENPKLKMEEAQSILIAAGGPRMRPQRIYDLRKEVRGSGDPQPAPAAPAASPAA